MKQRLTALLLALALLCALLPAAVLSASAEIVLPPDPFDDVVSGTCGENLTWELNKTNGVLTISGTGEMTEAPWLEYSGSIRYVSIDSGVENVGYGAFQLCTRLSGVTIPDSVTYIDYNAFAGCTGLTAITIPDSVTAIGGGAFSGCSKLTELTVPGSVTRIGDYAFQNCTGLTKVTLEDGVETVGLYAFAGCGNLKEITIPESVTAIGDSAFSGCTGLTDVYYGGIMAKWEKLTIGDGNECLTDADIHCIACTHKNTHDEHENATCTDAGYDRTVCDDCGELVSETTVPALGHDLVIIDEIPATCLGSGWTEGEYCTRCDYIVRPEPVEALGHDWDEGVVTLEPTETEKGEKTFTCRRCGETKTETVPELSHVHDYVAVVTDPTCTEQGYTTHVCECGDRYVDTYVDALGHDLVDHEAKAPSCTEAGWDAYQTCTRCDYTTYLELAGLGHDFKVTVVEPTCTEQGYTFYECTREGCGYTEKGSYKDALAHDYHDGVCTRCGEKDPDYTPEEPLTFDDVKEGDWYYGAVSFAVENGLMNGVGKRVFAPNEPMTRAMLVTVLWRYTGSPEEGANYFNDVPDDQWYTQAVAWASANKIVNGVGDSSFDPNGNITREQMAAILYRYAIRKGFDASKRGDLSKFPDEKKVSAYAETPIAWAVGEGLITGNKIGDKTLLDPQGSATRAQVATILMRFIENVAKK